MNNIAEYRLSSVECSTVERIIASLRQTYPSINDPTFIRNLPAISEEVPRGLRQAITRYKYENVALALRIRGFRVDQREIGPTPRHWMGVSVPNSLSDFYVMLISSVLGDVFGFSNLQNGKLIQEIFPIKEDSHAQLGTGSVELLLHTEDSSLDYRADYLAFFCNRNVDHIPTDLAAINPLDLSPSTREVLKHTHFKIYNDRPAIDATQGNNRYTECALLYGMDSDLRVRFDPLYTDMSNITEVQKSAIDELVARANSHVFPLLLEAGDIAFIDNTRCAHGRRAYKPRYDGTDRWLKRAQISNRLRAYLHLLKDGYVNVLP